MNLYQFNALNDEEKAEAVWDGALIGDRQDEEHNILLYQVDSFYVEVYHHRQKNTIKRFRSFNTTALLEPYLSKVDIVELLNT